MMEPTVIVLGRGRKRGRPRMVDPQVPVTTWIPQSQYDRLAAFARKHGDSMSGTVRTLISLQNKARRP